MFTLLSADCLLLSAVCLHFCQLISAIYLLLSAEISCLFTFCQLIFCAKIMVFWSLFCHYRCFNTLLVKNKKKSALCLQFSCLFTVCQLISADCLHFEILRQNHGFLVTFLPLQMLQHFACKRLKKKISSLFTIQLFVYFLSADFS